MPTAMRIFASVKSETPCPITVCEGKQWLSQLLKNKEIVQQLVESGVDINTPIPGPPVIEASMCRHYDITLYLLQAGAEYRNAYFVNVHSDTIGLLGTLRLDCYYHDLNSKRHRQKMKVVEYLMGKGMNYWEEPIPDYIQEKIKEMYPDTWKEFLEKY